MTNIIGPLVKDHILRMGPEWAVEDPYGKFKERVDGFREWTEGRNEVFVKLLKDDFNMKPAVNVTITANDFNKGTLTVNNEWINFDKKYKGEYYTENMIQITAKPAKGQKLKSWKLKKCKFVNQAKNSINVYPRKDCTVTVTFK